MQIYNTREDFLASLPKGGVIAEIGVFGGDHARSMLTICKPERLILIDPWQTIPKTKMNARWARMPQGELDQYYARVCSEFSKHPNVEILKMGSLEAAERFDDGHFDWVYIDADHSYEAVSQDLEAWFPKIKKGGFLCGHDYSNTEAVIKKGDGVYAAVNDFVAKVGLQVKSIAGDLDARCFSIQL